MFKSIAAGILGGFLAASAVSAEDAPRAPKGLLPVPDYSGDLWTRRYLAGDFNGGRTALANAGIQIDLDWTQVAQCIVDGGREEDSAYSGNIDALIHVDLMRMNLIQGGLLTIRAESRYGDSVN